MKTRSIVCSCSLVALLSAGYLRAVPSDVADAVMNRDKIAVRMLIQQKADVNAQQADGTTALMWAVSHNDLEMADTLLKSGADPKIVNDEGATAMYVACELGDVAIVDRLLKAGVDVNAPMLAQQETAVMVASRTGRPEVVKLLLDRGAKVDAKEKLRDTTALIWAAEQNHADVVRILAEHGADVNAASRKARPVKQSGTDYDVKTDGFTGGLPALTFAVREDALDALKTLVGLKADVNKTTGDESTPLLVAVQNGFYDEAAYLVGHGADINRANDKGWNPLYIAIKNRNLETGTIPVPNADKAIDFIKLLLDRTDMNINQRVRSNTELHNGFRATWLNEAGATPFLRAALCGDIEVMKMLLAQGADPQINTTDGTTPLMAAAGVGYTEGFIHDRSTEETIEAMKLILDLGANVNAANHSGLTALHGAAHKASLEEIQLLVDRGANLAARDKGNTNFGGNGKKQPDGLLPLNWAEGVPIGAQSAIYHFEAVDLITKLMKEQGIPLPTVIRTVGGNAKAQSLTRNQDKPQDPPAKK